MVHPLKPKKLSTPQADFDHFCQMVEALKGKFPLHKLDDEWVDRLVRTFPLGGLPG
jgi:hypothetical protein